jgi:hypothetical protein
MERKEKWESLRLGAQKFAPQEFVAVCDTIKDYHIESFKACGGSYKIHCGNHQHEVANSAGSITINPSGWESEGYASAGAFMQEVIDLINGSDDFYVDCNGVRHDVLVLHMSSGAAGQVIGPSTIDNWWAGKCNDPNSSFTGAHTFVPGDMWEEILKNQS